MEIKLELWPSVTEWLLDLEFNDDAEELFESQEMMKTIKNTDKWMNKNIK